jgi:phage/plasmid-associated DNA primase
VRLIPFKQRFNGPSADKHLDAKLRNERGILAWLVRASLEWQDKGLQIPPAVATASRQYQESEDPLGEFVAQHVSTTGPGFYLKDAYWLYTTWAKSDQITHPRGRNRFGDQLESRGLARGVKRNRPYYTNGTLIFTSTCLRTPCACMPTSQP